MRWRFEGIDLVLQREACYARLDKPKTCSLAFRCNPEPDEDWWSSFSDSLMTLATSGGLFRVEGLDVPVVTIGTEIERVPEAVAAVQEAGEWANEEYRKGHAEVLEAQARLDDVLDGVAGGGKR